MTVTGPALSKLRISAAWDGGGGVLHDIYTRGGGGRVALAGKGVVRAVGLVWSTGMGCDEFGNGEIAAFCWARRAERNPTAAGRSSRRGGMGGCHNERHWVGKRRWR